MYSFLLAADVVDEDVVVMNSDLFFHPERERGPARAAPGGAACGAEAPST